MSELFVYIREDLSVPWHWFLSATKESGRASTPEQKNDIGQQNFSKLIIIIPGMQVTTKTHTLGNLNRKQLKQAAGFSIEDELAVSLEETHFSFDPNSDRLSVIAKSAMHGLLAELTNYGLSPDTICADYDCINTATPYLVEGCLISQDTEGLGYSVENELIAHLEGKSENAVSISRVSFLELASEAYSLGHLPTNLRQGEFSKRTEFSSGRFKRSAWLAVACAALFVGFNLGQGMLFQQKTKAVKAEINTIYAQIFPGLDVPKNPVLSVLKAQAEQKVVGGETFIKLSSILARSVQDVDGIELVSLGYDKGRSQISLSIIYNSFDDVERLKTAVTRHGGTFLESGTRQSNSGLVGDAILKAVS